MNNEIQFLLYTMPDEEGKVQVVVKDETLWCTQKAMAQLFGVDRSVITKHLKNVFETQELVESSVCAKIAHAAEDGKTYQTNFYSLDAIIAVGYRVNSLKATRFRQWATKILSEYNQILPDKGKISAVQAKAKAEAEYDIFNRRNALTLILTGRLEGCLVMNNNCLWN